METPQFSITPRNNTMLISDRFTTNIVLVEDAHLLIPLGYNTKLVFSVGFNKMEGSYMSLPHP